MGVSLEEMLGLGNKVELRKDEGLPDSAVMMEDMLNVAPTPADEADGLFMRSFKAIKDFETGGAEHPLQNIKGVAKGLAAGAVTLGRLGASGLAGLATAAVGKGYDTGAQAVEKWVEADRKASEGVLYINLAPVNKQEEAFQRFLGIIPDAITAAGDTVYEKTGSALAGAGSQAMLTLLTMKPSVAARPLSGLKSLKNPKASPASIKSGEKVKAAFDELAVKNPQGAESMVDHVAKTDPELAKILTEAIEEAKAKSPEAVGKAAAKAKADQRAPETVAPASKSTASSIADDISKSIEELPDAISAKPIELTKTENKIAVKKANEAQLDTLVKDALKDADYIVDKDTGEHTISIAGAELRAQENGNYLQIKRADVVKELQGKGITQSFIMRLVGEAKARGLTMASDVTVSKEAQRVYRGLKKKGYEVKQNPSTVNKETGSLISADPRKPVYEVSKIEKPWNPAETQASALPDPVIYTDANRGVTRSSVETAFRIGAKVTDAIPGVRLLKGKLSEYYDQLIRTVNPEALGPEAKISAAVLAKNLAEQMQKDSSYSHRSAERRSFWNHMGNEASKEFISNFERGTKSTNPLYERAAEGYRNWNEEILAQDKRNGIHYEAEENYLYHVFEDSVKVAEFFTRKFGPKWNNPGFIKERGFALYDQAVAAGYKPKFTNPEDIMLARQHASDVASMQVNTLRELKSAGLAEPITKGSKNRPEGYPSTEWRAPNGERYWVHTTAAAVMNNAFNTKSLWSMPGIVGDAFRGAMWLKNTIVPIKLALSLFHPLHVLTIDNATGMVRASKELLSGTMNPAKFMAEMGKATFYNNLISAPKSGYRLLKAYQGRIKDADLTPADSQALQYMAEGGFIPEMAAQYKTSAIQKFWSAVEQRKATAAWHLPFAAISYLQKPMFELWIPSLKIASYLKDVKTAVKVDPTLVDNPLRRQLAFRRIAKSVDNRYGEMAYSTLFWNRWIKDLGVANTLSMGWQLGFIREYGGGMMDLGQVISKEGSVTQKAKSGMLDRPLFVAFYTTQAMAYGGLMTWAMTGKPPSGLIDYVYPKIGEKEDGTPERVTTMFYPREFMSIYKHMENEGVVGGLGHLAASKASGVIGLTSEWARGVDSFGKEIRDPDAPAYKQLEQTLAHTLVELEPISVSAMKKQGSENPVRDTILNISGFGPAPKYVTESKTESLIKGTFQKYFGSKQTPYERAQYSEERRELKKLYADGDGDAYDELLQKMIDKYELTGKEQRKLEQSIAKSEDPLNSMFERLTWRQQKKILDQMTNEERENFLPMASRQHLRYSYEPPEPK